MNDSPWREKKFDTWTEFRDYLEGDLHPAYTLFRGQRDEKWGLQTSLDRLLGSLPVKFKTEDLVKIHYNRFVKAARGRGTNSNNNSEENWWALGQHHGLATPLLDWSESPYIAVYFAFSSPEPSSSGYRSVWALVPNALELANKDVLGEEERAKENEGAESFYADFLEKSRPPVVHIVEPLSDDNPRLVNQAGLFTRAPIGMNLEQWVERHSKIFKVPVLQKFLIPDDERFDALIALQKMNIHSQSMFPDLSGASTYCNEVLSLHAEELQVNQHAREILDELEVLENKI